MTNTHQQSVRRLNAGLLAISFGIGYFGAEFLPTIAMARSISTAEVSTMATAYAAAQILGLILLGYLTDKAKPLFALKLSAWLLSIAAIAGASLSPQALLTERILMGLSAGAIGSLYRTIGRTSTDPNTRTKMMAHASFIIVLGTAVGTIAPIIGSLALPDTIGRGFINLLVALVVATIAARMPRMGRSALTESRIHRPSGPLAVLFALSFFSAGAYAVFILVISKEIIPNLPVSQTVIWSATAVLYLLGAVIGSRLNRLSRSGFKSVDGLIAAVCVLGFAYILPTINGSIWLVLSAELLVIIAGAFADSFWSSLVSTLSSPLHQGSIFGLGLIIAAAGRAFWTHFLAGAIGIQINWQQALLFTLLLALVGALTAVINRHKLSAN